MSCNNKVFVNQALDINIFFGDDITGQTAIVLNYKKPDNTTGQFVASSVDDTKGQALYQATTGELDQSGTWTFQGVVTLPSGNLPGCIYTMEINAVI